MLPPAPPTPEQRLGRGLLAQPLPSPRHGRGTCLPRHAPAGRDKGRRSCRRCTAGARAPRGRAGVPRRLQPCPGGCPPRCPLGGGARSSVWEKAARGQAGAGGFPTLGLGCSRRQERAARACLAPGALSRRSPPPPRSQAGDLRGSNSPGAAPRPAARHGRLPARCRQAGRQAAAIRIGSASAGRSRPALPGPGLCLATAGPGGERGGGGRQTGTRTRFPARQAARGQAVTLPPPSVWQAQAEAGTLPPPGGGRSRAGRGRPRALLRHGPCAAAAIMLRRLPRARAAAPLWRLRPRPPPAATAARSVVT